MNKKKHIAMSVFIGILYVIILCRLGLLGETMRTFGVYAIEYAVKPLIYLFGLVVIVYLPFAVTNAQERKKRTKEELAKRTKEMQERIKQQNMRKLLQDRENKVG
ncbi:MAG: hypothetical protein MJZ34_05190 [Paludibacteraceae bacterium]|nr:hypothetical protein [Paludibacteraceae bacterium]